MAQDTDFKLLREKAGWTVQDVAKRCKCSERTVYRWEKGESSPNPLIVDELHRLIDLSVVSKPKLPEFDFIDLFAGIGGMRMGFESAGGHCVFTSEWNKFSRQTYRENFGCDHEIFGDITQVEVDEIPRHDVLLAGFPCQPFSIAGVSKKNALGQKHGFECKTQGTLFFDVARILKSHKPVAFLLENVKNLKSHDKGRTFRIICETLDELGYYYDYRVVDAKGYVPQHRERVFIAGFIKDTGFSFDDIDFIPAEQGPKMSAILHPEDGTEEDDPPYTEGSKAKVASKYTLSEHLWTYLQNYAEKHKKKGNGFGFGLVGREDVARTLSARYYKDGSEILIKQNRKRPRRLTPRECARLMGFDRPSAKFEIKVSDTQAYQQFGNAVVVPVVEAIARHMKPHIKKIKRDSTLRQREMPLIYKNTTAVAGS